MTGRILVAGIGNIFLGDDGFGSAVAERLAARSWPDGVTVRDFGVRGVHLAYELLDGYDVAVLIDTVHGEGPPGTLYLIEPDGVDDDTSEAPAVMNAHDMSLESVLALVPQLGGTLGEVLVVGCEPSALADRMGLSDPVAASVDVAAGMVEDIVERRRRQG